MKYLNRITYTHLFIAITFFVLGLIFASYCFDQALKRFDSAYILIPKR